MLIEKHCLQKVAFKGRNSGGLACSSDEVSFSTESGRSSRWNRSKSVDRNTPTPYRDLPRRSRSAQQDRPRLPQLGEQILYTASQQPLMLPLSHRSLQETNLAECPERCSREACPYTPVLVPRKTTKECTFLLAVISGSTPSSRQSIVSVRASQEWVRSRQHLWSPR